MSLHDLQVDGHCFVALNEFFQTLAVFHSLYLSDGWTRTEHVMAGVDYSIDERFALTTEARYLWASAALSRDFSGFQNLDLSGYATTVGLSVRF